MMENWDNDIKNRIDAYKVSLPDDDFDVFESKYRKHRIAKVVSGVMMGVSAAAAIALFLILSGHNTNQITSAPEVGLLAQTTTEAAASTSTVTSDVSKTEAPSIKAAAHSVPTERITDEKEQASENIDDCTEQIAESDEHPEATMQQIETDAVKETAEQTDAFYSDPFADSPLIAEASNVHSTSVDILGTVSEALASASTELAYNPPSGVDIGPQPNGNPVYESMDADHQRPITFGLNARYNLSPRLSLVSGVEYSRYRSTFTHKHKKDVKKQVADYIGIPVRLDYAILQRKYFSIYTGAGIKADWCARARFDDMRIEDKDIHWSANALFGIQYDIDRRFGIYFEPVFSYYLNSNNSSIETYRTENPFVFSLSLGMRFTLKR